MVHDMVNRLTDNPALRTFFTLYLMAKSSEERQVLSKQFWQEVETLQGAELQVLKDAFSRSFKQLLPMVNQLHEKTLNLTSTIAVTT
ncbi:MAG: hypothetical protein H7246_02840 [Phycisphaerae bacterium]|nr:hypothetical protein [Saprospiraceae bacterium]